MNGLVREIIPCAGYLYKNLHTGAVLVSTLHVDYAIITNMCKSYNFDAAGPEKPLSLRMALYTRVVGNYDVGLHNCVHYE